MTAAPHSPLVEQATARLRKELDRVLMYEWPKAPGCFRIDGDINLPSVAQAALDACHAEEMRAFIREIANDDLDRVSPGLISRAAVLLAKLDSAP